MSIKNSEKRMFELVEQWKQSNKSMKIFAEENNLTYFTFQYWCRKFKEKKITKPNNSSAGFIPVTIKEPQKTSSKIPQIEFHLPNGIEIKVY